MDNVIDNNINNDSISSIILSTTETVSKNMRRTHTPLIYEWIDLHVLLLHDDSFFYRSTYVEHT